MYLRDVKVYFTKSIQVLQSCVTVFIKVGKRKTLTYKVLLHTGFV